MENVPREWYQGPMSTFDVFGVFDPDFNPKQLLF